MAQRRPPILACLLLALTAGCAGGGNPRTAHDTVRTSPGPGGAAEREEEGATVRPVDPELAREVDEALDRVLATGEREGVDVLAECGDDGTLTEVRIYGSGVGVWNRSRQFTLPPERLTALLERFRDVGFSRFQELYGTIKREIPVPEDAGASALRVVCRVALTVDGITKQSSQLSRGPRSEELRSLADEILALGRGPGASGATAESLDDGLGKVARGVLAPEVLRVLLHRKPDPRALAAGEPGFLLRIEGKRATVETIAPGAGYGEPVEVGVSARELADLAGLLADSGAGGLPLNLHADHYTDLVVEVLDRRREIQARPFSGMTPTTHGEAQERFDRIYDRLAELASTAATPPPQVPRRPPRPRR